MEGKSVGYVFLGSSPVAIFCLSDVCRTGAKEAIEELKSLGIKTVMLTGDCQGAAKHAQEQVTLSYMPSNFSKLPKMDWHILESLNVLLKIHKT